MIIYIDPVSGISGDMLLGALLDLGAQEDSLHTVGKKVSRELGSEVEIKVQDVRKKGIISKSLTVAAREEGIPVERLKQGVVSLSKTLELGEAARKFTIETLDTLLRAEKVVHGKELHLHELGSTDTLVDVLGAARLAEELGFFDENTRVYSSPVVVGSGTIETAHGTLPVPAPVTAEILKTYRIPFRFSAEKGELATPTGVALLANLVHSFRAPLAPIKVGKIGRGAGAFDLEGMPNILRIMTLSSELKAEAVSVIETSVDDVTGEVLGYVIERLYDEGALDVQVMPTITKKNRPGYIIFILGEAGEEEELAKVLMEETGTLGVRISPSQMRFTAEREIKKIKVSLPGYKGEARVKVSYLGDKKQVKAEFEDAKKIARKTGLSLKEVLRDIEEGAT